MRPLIKEIQTQHTPESLVENLRSESGIVLLRSNSFDSPQARYSFVAARPFLTFRSFGSRSVISNFQLPTSISQIQFGNPWHLLDSLMSRFELLDEIDLPFPLGGGFGYWGYDLKNFTIWNCPTATSVSTTASPSSTIVLAKSALFPPD
jgi:anthranilate/para-aminobenzoate synthase component I